MPPLAALARAIAETQGGVQIVLPGSFPVNSSVYSLLLYASFDNIKFPEQMDYSPLPDAPSTPRQGNLMFIRLPSSFHVIILHLNDEPDHRFQTIVLTKETVIAAFQHLLIVRWRTYDEWHEVEFGDASTFFAFVECFKYTGTANVLEGSFGGFSGSDSDQEAIAMNEIHFLERALEYLVASGVDSRDDAPPAYSARSEDQEDIDRNRVFWFCTGFMVCLAIWDFVDRWQIVMDRLERFGNFIQATWQGYWR